MKLLSEIQFWFYRSRRKLATAGVGLVVLMLTYHIVYGENGALIYAKKRSEYQRLDTEIQQLQDENVRLSDHIHALKTDPKTIEKEAREQLKYARPGEVVFTVPDENPKTKTATASKSTK